MSGAGNTLREAYSSPANAPSELLRFVFPGCEPRLAADGAGVMCDPRGGQFAERSPSFTFWRGQDDGGACFQRKGTGETWNALTLLEQYGNGGAGMSRAEAASLLISRAGLEHQDAEQLPRSGGMRPAPRPSLGATLREKQGKDYAPDPLSALKGWTPILSELEEGQVSGPAREALEAGGLLSALPELFEAYQAGKSAKVSRLITRDALAFVVRGPDGKPAAVKFRNHGTAEELSAAGRDRYV